MSEQQDRIYFAQRAAEEQELARSATDAGAAQAHLQLSRAYLERASVGERPMVVSEVVG